MRAAYPGTFGYNPTQASGYDFGNSYGNGAGSENDRVANLKRAIESIEQRLQSQPPVVPPYAQPQFQHQGYGAGAPMHSAPDLNLMQAQLNQLTGQLGLQGQMGISPQGANPTGFSGGAGDVNSAIAEIARRQQTLNQGSTPTHTASAMQQQNQPAPVNTIGQDLAELKKELGEIRKEVAKPIAVQQSVPQAEIDRIASAISELQSQNNPNERTFDRLTKELDELRNGMAKDVKSAMKSAHRAESEQKNSALKSQFDELTRNLDQVSLQTANQVGPRVDQLSSQLDALRITIDDLPQTLSISHLEEQLSNMVAKVEQLVSDSSRSTPQENQSTDVDLSSVERRLDEVARALVAVSNSGRKAPEVDLSAVDRVEARLAELTRSIDMAAKQGNGPELDNLAVRIDGLTDRLGSFEKYAESGDLGGANAMFASPETGVIEDQLRALNARIEEAALHSQSNSLEEQIAVLAARVEEASNVNSTAAQMSNLEAQIGQIVRHLNKNDAGVSVDFAPVEARLGQIENQLVSNQNFSLEAAQQAAQQAVAMMGSQSEPGQIIEALSQDLRSLQTAAESGNASTAKTFLDVQTTLQQVANRLVSIEGAIEEVATRPATTVVAEPRMPAAANLSDHEPVDPSVHASMMDHHSNETAFAADRLMDAAATEEQLGVIQQAAVNAGFINDPSSQPETLKVDAPSIDPSEQFDPSFPGDNTPLEPGFGSPDIDRLIEQASEKLNEVKAEVGDVSNNVTNLTEPNQASVSGDEVDDVRPDAVAAARRALQATTAEMNAVRDEATTTEKKSSISGLKGKLEALVPNFDMAKLRKPLVMGAAALLLAIVAFKGYSIVAGGKDPQVAKADAPKVEMSVTDKTTADKTTEGSTSEVSEAPSAVRVIDGDTPSTPAAASDEPNDVAKTEMVDSAADADTMEKATEPVSPSSGNEVVDNAIATQPAQSENPAPTDDAVVADNASVTIDDATETPDVAAPVAPAAVYDVPANAGPAALVAAASTGDAKALFQLGMRYSEGDSVKRNMTESAKWFQRSADTGFAPAQYSIGSLYEKGIGVERNLTTASTWYDKAAAQGNARAMHNLAVIQAMGNPPEIQPNMDRAVVWFQKAANLGIKDSQFNLGILYGQGMGVPQNLGESYKWFALAAKTGDNDAGKKRDEVANAMDPDDLDEARKEVNNWAPGKLDVEVNRVSVPEEWRGKGNAPRSSAGASNNSSVKQAQALLNQRGFSVGKPDGLMGPKTKKAIMEFQRSAGIPITGKVDSKLLKALDLQT